MEWLRVESFECFTKKLYHRRRKLVHLGMSGGKIFKRGEDLFFKFNLLKILFFKKKIIFLHVA